jgi:hypothetical protein
VIAAVFGWLVAWIALSFSVAAIWTVYRSAQRGAYGQGRCRHTAVEVSASGTVIRCLDCELDMRR